MLNGKSLVLNQMIVLAVIAVLAAVSLFSIHRLNSSATEMGEGKDVVADILPPPLYLIEAQLTGSDMLHAAPDDHAALIEKLHALKKDYDTRNKYWEQSTLDMGTRASLLGEQRTQGELYWQETLEHFVPAIQSGNLDAANVSFAKMRLLYGLHRKGVDATVNIATKYAEEKLSELSSATSKGYWVIGLASLFGLASVLLISVPTINRIYRSLHGANIAVSAISGGDLSHPIPPAGKDEVGQLLGRIAEMRDQLAEIIRALGNDVRELEQESTQLSRVAASSAESADTQAEATSSMAAAIEELSVSIDQVGDSAAGAQRISQDSADRSQQGGAVIQHAIDEMQRIATVVTETAENIRGLESEANQISAIVNVIKEIADQTNLLALNAAIEAARAGEQGRGFAVVADEVRKLAERTSQATVEITGMISKIQQGAHTAASGMEAGVERVSAGVELASKAGQQVTQMQASSQTVAHEGESIAVALKEQSTAIQDLSNRVENIAQGTDQIAASARLTRDSAAALHKLASSLAQLTSKFRVG